VRRSAAMPCYWSGVAVVLQSAAPASRPDSANLITVCSMHAKDFMVTRLVTLPPEMDVLEAVHILVKNCISGAPVVDGQGKYLGMFSEKCAMHAILDAAYDQLPTSEVRAFMDTEAQTIGSETDLLAIAQLFLLTPFRRLPVLDEEGMLLGQVSRRDVLRAAIEHLDLRHQAERERSLLYLSAIFERHDAPLR
jgi:predicted transcriptional regulator